MAWKIIEISEGSKLRVFLDNLIIEKNNIKIKMYLKDIDVIIIDNCQIMLSTQLLNVLSNLNICTIVCDRSHLPNLLLLPIHGNYNTLKIFEKQLDWNFAFKANAWKKIIENKIQNQIYVLEKYHLLDNIDLLKNLISKIKPLDISNIEGYSSKIYWQSKYGKNFNRKNENSINFALNYGYALIRSLVARSITKKGLDCRIALFHKSFSNHFALASDLMEVFRFVIDEYVYKIYLNSPNIIDWKKSEIIELIANKKIKFQDKNFYLSNAIDLYIDQFVNSSCDNLITISNSDESEIDSLLDD